MSNTIRVISVGSILTVAALVLGVCSTLPLAPVYPPSGMPGYGPGGMGGSGGMMGGGGMMGSGGMMGGGGGYGQYVPVTPTAPVGATPVPVGAEILITASDYRFKPDQITVKPGETVRFVVTNRDGTLHNLIGQEAGIPYLDLPARSTQTLTWTAPLQTGTYTAVCTLHAGMSLSIVVAN